MIVAFNLLSAVFFIGILVNGTAIHCSRLLFTCGLSPTSYIHAARRVLVVPHAEAILALMDVDEMILEDFIGSDSVEGKGKHILIPTCTFQASFIGHTELNRTSHLA